MFRLSPDERRPTVARFAAAARDLAGGTAEPLDYRRLCGWISQVSLVQDLTILFDGDREVEKCFDDHALSEVSRYGNPVPSAQRAAWSEQVHAALGHLRSGYPAYASLVEDVVAIAMVVPGPGNGGCSVSTLPGVVFVNPSQEWTWVDFAECIIHEATHLSLFLVDMFDGLFADDADQVSAHVALSAVRRGEYRPVDAALHAAVVAAMLLSFNRDTGSDAFEDKYGASFEAAVADLSGKRKLLSRTGECIVDDLCAFAATPRARWR